MPTKRSRISAGIVLGCVLVIVCASALGRDALQEGTPKAAQTGECMSLLWGESYCLACGTIINWPDEGQIRQNYTVCAGFDHAINITWDSHTLLTTYVNVSIGTTLLARNRSGNILLLYSQLPADKENITLINDNGASINEFEYDIALVNANPEPQMNSNVPIQGGGVVIAIVYAAVIIFGIASFKLPQKFRILALIGNIIMPIVWFGGSAMGNVAPPTSGFMMMLPGGGPTFTITEGGGLVLTAGIDFVDSDPYYMGFTFLIYEGHWFTGTPVYYGEFGVGSAYTGYKSETTFLPLPPGEYSIEYSGTPSYRMEIGIYTLSAWSDIAPATSVGMWRWAFLTIGICAAVVALVAVIKGKSKGKTTKIVPKPSFQGTGNVIDVPFSAISSSAMTAPPAPVTAGPIVSWTCDACGKANEEAAKFCIGCGKARRPG